MSESADFEVPTQEDFRCDLREPCLGAIRLTLETLLNEEIGNMVGAGRWQRIASRKDVRNGSYLRKLVTSMGLVDVEVPRARRRLHSPPRHGSTNPSRSLHYRARRLRPASHPEVAKSQKRLSKPDPSVSHSR